MRRWPGGPDEGENFMTLKDLARSLRQNETDAEREMWTVLRSRRFSGFKFRQQQSLGHYIVDFFCKDRGLIVELDAGTFSWARGPRRKSRVFYETKKFGRSGDYVQTFL
jgi:very-short-patch-repair endonuclease